MKKKSTWLLSLFLVIFSLNSALSQRFWIATSPGNWSNTANWSTTSGGPGGASVPGPGDLVTFNGVGGRTGNCTVDINPGSINGLTINSLYTGTINLNGFNLTLTGANTLTGGTISGSGSTLILNTSGSTAVNGCTFNVPVSGSTGRIILNGGIFNQALTITKTNVNDDDGTGNNRFGGPVTLINNTANRIRLATTTRDIFNSTLTLTVNSTGSIEPAYNSAVATQFNDNITINYNTTAAVRFGFSNGISTVASGKTLTINSGGAGAGSLTLGGITFLSGQSIALTGNTTAAISIKTNSVFNGTTSITAPTYNISASRFNGPTTITKTGASVDDLTGGNTYGSTVNIVNSGDGQFNFAATNPDTFNGDLQIDNTAGGRVQIGINSAGNVINGILTVNHGGSTAGINCIFARNTGSSLTINGDVFLNQSNGDASSGIIIGNQGNVTINGNVTMASNNGRGILFAAGSGSTVTIGSGYALKATETDFIFGSLNLQNVTQLGTATQTVNLGGTAIFNIGNANEFNGPVDFRARQVTLDSSNFKNSAIIEKNGAGDNGGNGGSTFAGPTTLRNSGSGIFYNSGNNTFNGTTTIESTGSNYISFEHFRGSTYNGPVTYNNTGSGFVRAARDGNTKYNDNIVVNSSGGTGILFCETATGTATLVSGKTITTSGFSAGELRLKQFTQQGSTAQSLTLVYPGTGLLTLGPASSFGGNVTFSAPRVLLNGTTFNGTSSLTKTGATTDNGNGGNVFIGATTIANSGSASLVTGNVSPDTFNGVLTINNNGSSTIRFSDNAAGTQFNNNIILNTSAGTGIYFGTSGGTSILADDRTITAGSVLAGDIRLLQFTQNNSVTTQTLDLDGIAILTIGPGSKFGGSVDFRAPQLYLNGCTYGTTAANTARLEKEGATENVGNGGNIFNATTTIINSGSNSLRTAGVTKDIFNASLTGNNASGAGATLSFSYTAANNEYNGNITVSSVLGSAGVTFGQNGGTSTLTPTGVLAIGPAGFVSGDLRFARFTQSGTQLQTLVLTPPASGTARLRLGPNSSFGGEVNFRAPRVLLEGCTFGGVTYIEKTGATDDFSSGGNFFNGTTSTIANSGTGWFINGDAAKDEFNTDLTLTNTGSAGIRMADNIPGNVFNGNIIVNSNFGSGIYFCESNTAASAQLADTKTITIGGLGFTSGDLRLRRFTVIGTNNQALTLTGTAGLRLGPNATFNGDVNFKAPQLYINTGSVYNGTATLEKTGSTNDTGSGGSLFTKTTSIKNSGAGVLRTNGGNTFNGTTTLTDSGAGDLLLELVTGGTYNGDVAMINTGSSQIRAGYIGTTDFNGNITVSSTSGTGIIFGEQATNVNLADTKTITVAGSFTAGELRFSHFNQVGSGTPQTLTLTGAAQLTFNLASTFGSNLTTSSPRLFLNGATFNGVNSFTKTNASNDDSSGGNTFGGNTTIINSGTGRLRLANTNGDVFNANATFTRSTSSAGTYDIAYNGTNTFGGNVTVGSSTTMTFGGGTGTQTFNGTGTQTINRSDVGVPQINRLIVNKPSGGITLNTETRVGVSGVFTQGIITSTSTNFINFQLNATASGASNASHVSGPVRKVGTDAFIYPTGKNGIYKSIAIGTRTTSEFTAEYFNNAQAISNLYGTGIARVSGCEYWGLFRSSGSGTPTVTLSWKNSDCSSAGGPYVSNTADLRVAGYEAATSRWQDRGNGGVTAGPAGLPDEGTIISSASIPVYSFFALASATTSNALPIELLDFTAANMGAFVHVTWSTASETNNDFFTIQRSHNGSEFASVGTVKGAGSSRKHLDYSFADETPLAGVSYYRLKQTDFDGKTSYSKVVKIDRDAEAVLMVYPNPLVGDKAYTNIKGTFTIYNSVGQPILTKENSNEFDLSGVSPGVYLVRSSSGQVCRLVVK